MGKLGEWLRAAREESGLTLEDAELGTRIRVRYLEALEAGNYRVMSGGEAQVRGFLRRYAAFLGLSPDEAIARYEQETGASAEQPLSAAPTSMGGLRPVEVRPSRPVLPFLLAVVLIVGLALVAWWAVPPLQLPFGGGSPPTPVGGAQAPLATGSSEAPPAASPTPTFPVAAGGGVTLTLEALEHVWVRVTTDGMTAFEGMLAPGQPQTWTGRELVVVETGNGAGVVAVVNGQRQGVLGGRGDVCVRGWGPEGEVDLPSGGQ